MLIDASSNFIRPMEQDDVSRVAEIHVFGWRSAYRGMISDEILFKRRLVSRSMALFESSLGSEDSETWVYDDGILKGSMTIGACRDEDKQGAFEVWGIYVEPLMQREGVGTKLLHHAEKLAAERGYKEICIWVLEQNTQARGFYEKHGYNADGSSKYIDFLAATEVMYTKHFASTPTGEG